MMMQMHPLSERPSSIDRNVSTPVRLRIMSSIANSAVVMFAKLVDPLPPSHVLYSTGPLIHGHIRVRVSQLLHLMSDCTHPRS